MSSSTSTIRAVVQWLEPTVFAGEEIQCQITFKNIAVAPGTLHPSSNTPKTSTKLSAPERHRDTIQPGRQYDLRVKPSNGPTQSSIHAGRGHRSTLSLNVPLSASRLRRPDVQSSTESGPHTAQNDRGHVHRRSLSIISLGTDSTINEAGNVNSAYESPRIPFRRHGRAASLQVVPRRAQGNNSPPVLATNRSTTQPSPLFDHSSSEVSRSHPQSNPSYVPSTRPSTLRSLGSLNAVDHKVARRKGALSPAGNESKSPNSSFRFPASPSPPAEMSPSQTTARNNGHSHGVLSTSNGHLSPLISSDHSQPKDAVRLPSRILSPTGHGDTPRSSAEFYSLSNNSTETLASEYLPHSSGVIASRLGHGRHPSALPTTGVSRPSDETLMMGYAQVQGSFILDGSLVDQQPFEEVKRKAVVGGQGGGVIGLESNKRESSLLRGFGWGNITESLGGLLRGGELSTIKDMRGVVNSRSIPLLSTPQSILFVDLRLSPGESRTFQYSFKLPRGLPPTHRGKAIKISYQLVLGTQRPGGTTEHKMRSVEVPFRVLGSVNEHGELLGHDLMSPYIIMRDEAFVSAISGPSQRLSSRSKALTSRVSAKKKESTRHDFLNYVDEMLSHRQNASELVLTPTSIPQLRRLSSVAEPTSVRDAIDMAIIRSNLATDSQQSANRFEIARGGQRVSIVMLARPAYRLGETVTAVIDFGNSEIACYAVHISLESSEKVDQSLALRSDVSVNRVTRKVYASHSESALFAQRIVFSPSIPLNATPSFITSGICLEWKLLIEFVTPRADRSPEGNDAYDGDLLDEMSRDDRGAIFAATEVLNCESFEIAVPLRVYGVSSGVDDRDEDVEGLRV